MPVWGLEHLLLFGPPENKLELIDGRTPVSFPFADRATADAHFQLWAKTLAQWQGLADPAARVADGAIFKEFGEFQLTQYRRPIRLGVPSAWDGYEWAYRSFWERSLWPTQPEDFETGLELPQDHFDVKHNLWSICRDAQNRLGFEAEFLGGVDICLTGHDVVQPDFFIFPGPREQHLVGREYFRGVPQFVAEVLSPFSRAIDRGIRKEIYRRARVPELWLIEPLTQSVQVYRLNSGEYELERTAGPGDDLPVSCLSGLTISIDRLMRTQSSRFQDIPDGPSESPPDWGVSRDCNLGLQHLILLGHTERRREIWNDQSPCFMAFGSSEEARYRLENFLVEAARWTDSALPELAEVEPDVEAADVQQFHFFRRHNIVGVNVDAKGLLYQALLDVSSDRRAWDWGQK